MDKSNSSKTGSISVAAGKHSAIQGSGSIGKSEAKFTPNFEHSLAPFSVFTSDNIGLIVDSKFHIIESSQSLIDSLDNLINQAKNQNLSMLCIECSNGV